jgi:hypothetical protein
MAAKNTFIYGRVLSINCTGKNAMGRLPSAAGPVHPGAIGFHPRLNFSQKK